MIKKIKELVVKLDDKLYWSFKSVERKIMLLRESFFPSTVDDILNKTKRELCKLAHKKDKEATALHVQSMFFGFKALEAENEIKKAISAFLRLGDRG